MAVANIGIELLTTKQVADELGVTRMLILRFIKKGRLKAIKVGDIWLLDRRDVDAFSRIPRKTGRPAKKS